MQWFDARDLLIPILPAAFSLVMFFITWHPIFLAVSVALFGVEAIIIMWRVEK